MSKYLSNLFKSKNKNNKAATPNIKMSAVKGKTTAKNNKSKSKVASAMVKTPPAKPVSTNKKTASGNIQVKTPAAFNKPAEVPALQQPSVNERDRNLIGDTLWLFLLVVTGYLMLTLLTFSMKDPSWSRSIPRLGEIMNVGGLAGAYLADILYYIFGLSAWWFVGMAGIWLYRNFRPILDKGTQPYNPMIAGTGLGILLLTSPVLEAFAFGADLDRSLPLGAGGFVGSMIASGLNHALGATGSVALFFIISMLAFSLLIQISWLDFMERLGNQLERLFQQIFHDKDSKKKIDGQSEKGLESKIVQPRSVLEAEQIVSAPVTPPVSSMSNRSLAVKHTMEQEQSENVVPAPKKRQLQVTKPAIQTTDSLLSDTNDVMQPEHGEYQLPVLGSLKTPNPNPVTMSQEQLDETAQLIEEKLAEFGIHVEVVEATSGPVITRYEILPAKGVKGSQIVNLSKDLARSLKIQSVRVVETILGKNTMGIEVPNEHRQEVVLQEILKAQIFTEAKSKLTVALGKDIAGNAIVGDLAKMPHLLVGGMTGSGKSVGVNAMIMSMLYKAKPDEVRFIMIDPKMLELSVYEGIPHLLCPVVTDMKEAGNALNWCVAEMEKRYRLLAHVGVRNLAGYNEKIQAAIKVAKPIPNPFSLNPDDPEPLETLPQIVVVIDELADLMMTEKKAVETQIARLAQKARAAGIHMIIATQRPSVDVITGLIKANVPTRMAFTVQSRIDSRTILDQMGAEDLLKQGDLLFLQPGEAEPKRIQGAFVSDDEVHNVVAFIKAQAEPDYVEGILTGEATLETNQFINPQANQHGGDDLFDQAVQFVVSSRKTSISALQRHLRIGYNRAANLMQALEDGGIVSPAASDGKRQILARSLDIA
ncbi:DNA translocase FtsK 4TM domain-containing protein [Wielerella bovis]|uniref:DNA translocase FtsK n=1 Tax=Wielerella bovis TaxID=2917790 RepID=UPI002018E64F|nr:DNA translocase FtsK [Wielerella bovis]ULJ68464.1 DNA translocase FtsK 4TM domain-containing protein [Wielerella bovis]